MTTSMHGVPQGIRRPPAAERAAPAPAAEKDGHPATPGTIVLAAVFLAAFALYYFTNWKLLSLVWKIG